MEKKTSVPKLTKERAKMLIKRELGISATSLEMPPEYNGNKQFPWFRLTAGNVDIAVCSSGPGKVGYVYLRMYFSNSGQSISESFYADTLEFASEATELKIAEDLQAKIDDVADCHAWADSHCAHAGRKCREANDKHFGH